MEGMNLAFVDGHVKGMRPESMIVESGRTSAQVGQLWNAMA